MTRTTLQRSALAALLVLALAACGGEKDKSTSKATASDPERTAICAGTPLEGDSGLAADFPKPDGATYVKSKQAGPSRLVQGYYSGDLDKAFEDYKSALDGGDYSILKDEKEEDDAEVAFQSGDATGQVAMRECGHEGRIYLEITSRPK